MNRSVHLFVLLFGIVSSHALESCMCKSMIWVGESGTFLQLQNTIGRDDHRRNFEHLARRDDYVLAMRQCSAKRGCIGWGVYSVVPCDGAKTHDVTDRHHCILTWR